MKIFCNIFCVRRSDFFHINNMLVTRSLHVIFPFARACFPLKRIDSRDYPCNLSTAFHLLLRVDRSFEDIPCSWWTRAANAFLWIIAPLTERWNREINFLLWKKEIENFYLLKMWSFNGDRRNTYETLCDM